MFCCGIKLMKICMKESRQDTNLIIKCGKPVLVVTYRVIESLAAITLLSMIVCIFYCISMFFGAVKTKYHIGVYINMVSANKDGDFIPVLFALPGLLCLMLNCLGIFLLFKAFQRTKSIWINRIMYAHVLICLGSILIIQTACITILTHIYKEHSKLHDGIVDAMKNYSTDSKMKMEIDTMQIEFQCCGSKKYDEWYDIKWYDENLVKTSDGSASNAQTPFSCCAMQSEFPCIHHQIESTGSIYLYRPETNLSISRNGCFDMIKMRKQAVGWKVIGRLTILTFIMTIIATGMRLIQTGHFEKTQFMGEDRMYTIWVFGCYAGRKRFKIPMPPPVPEELKEAD